MPNKKGESGKYMFLGVLILSDHIAAPQVFKRLCQFMWAIPLRRVLNRGNLLSLWATADLVILRERRKQFVPFHAVRTKKGR